MVTADCWEWPRCLWRRRRRRGNSHSPANVRDLLIDAGAIVIRRLRAASPIPQRGLLELADVRPRRTLSTKFFAALGDLESVRAALIENESDPRTVNEAFVCACHFDREAVASFLLERSISLDPELGKQIDGGTDRVSFIKAFKKSDFAQVAKLGLWKVFVMEHVSRAVADGDLAAFVGWLQRETWLLGEESVDFQAGMIGAASLNDRGEIIAALLDLDPAILRRPAQRRKPSSGHSCTGTRTCFHCSPVSGQCRTTCRTRQAWVTSRVKRWFDASPASSKSRRSYPGDPDARHLAWDTPTAQQVLDVAALRRHQPSLRCSGLPPRARQDINTNWNSHEPASILHTGLSAEQLRLDAIPDRPRNQHDHQGLPLGQ